ncbi:hypothetical protein [Moraxella bovis]|uniref:Uncharacterized protein n=1 Tax=Moraxella bovis TaxID=476 RepID=A0ABY6M6N7_MORBO|nr:hypothetical protein [Moraxella bovis]UZA02949.1 hypothetical protein LP092_13590 [Moraxella bovis]UZA19160.1 hypothetical protein LP088_12830 [Moraxella bovis]UZA54042.1 hypothetical protein LP111_12805 [Moraxella bovis]UZA57352.1 hypothetical protein LP127_01370 [Moraxella bovis]
MSNLGKYFKHKSITEYLSKLMNINVDSIETSDMLDYTFMQKYLFLALLLDEGIMTDYLPEPIYFIPEYFSSKHSVIDDFLIENKDRFFELFYYYKGLKSL